MGGRSAKPRPAGKSVTEPDGPHTQLPLTQIDRHSRASIKTLDRSLKSFLRTSNLSGLEYRLKITGYNTFSDLLEADTNTLVKQGFTGLMARRLVSAVEEYLRKQGKPLEPYQIVRRGAQIQAEPTEGAKALPTFGKRNVKRKVSDGQPRRRISHEVHLMSEESLRSSQVIFPHALQISRSSSETSLEEQLEDHAGTTAVNTTENTQAASTAEVSANARSVADALEGESRAAVKPDIVCESTTPTAVSKINTPVIQSNPAINNDSPVHQSAEATSSHPSIASCEFLERCVSVSADFHWLGGSSTGEWILPTRLRAFSV